MISVPVLNEPEDYIFPLQLFDELVKNKTVSPIIIPRYPSFFSGFYVLLFPKLRTHHENRRFFYLESNHHGFYWAMNIDFSKQPTSGIQWHPVATTRGTSDDARLHPAAPGTGLLVRRESDGFAIADTVDSWDVRLLTSQVSLKQNVYIYIIHTYCNYLIYIYTGINIMQSQLFDFRMQKLYKNPR